MPLQKVFISFLFLFIFSSSLFAQNQPTSADVMRERISKAKAYLVVKNYSAAIYELENIKRETKDTTVNRVLNILLMHSYLEQGDYKKAEDFLKELHKSKQTNAAMDYFAVAGQVVSSAKKLLERYQALGLSVSDRNLPTEASKDVEAMRNTLELVVEQTGELSKNKQLSGNALALLEETSAARANIAKDEYDSKRWRDQISDAREQMVDSTSVIVDAVGTNPAQYPDSTSVSLNKSEEIKPAAETQIQNGNKKTTDNIFELKPVSDTPKGASDIETQPTEKAKPAVKTKSENSVSKEKPRPNTPSRPRVSSETSAENQEKKETSKQSSVITANNAAANVNKNGNTKQPITVGSLIGYATQKVNPVYPTTARSMRMTGVVKVEIMIDEDGKVAKIENTEGPAMLRRAAQDAVKKWEFKPFIRDGQPVKATGFINFNFSL